MIEFSIVVKTDRPGFEIFNSIFDVANWLSFVGWGPIPGIKKVELTQTDDSRVGTLFQVKNTDGSTHYETVLEYIPDQKLVMKIHHFSAPLNKITTPLSKKRIFMMTDLSYANDLRRASFADSIAQALGISKN